jgi:Fe-S-cluster containining protein
MSRGQYGFVYLTYADRKRMAAELKLTVRQFTEKHCDREDGWVYLKNPDQDCEFLDGKRCTVYEGRPTQCRTWPFWPENLNAKTWNNEVAPFCPGVGKGKLYTAKEIEALAKKDPLK